MGWDLDQRFRTRVNEDIIAFLERHNPSAHDDVASVLTGSAKGMPDVKWYCPNVHSYAYVVLHTTDNRIFAVAFGMNALGFRLPASALTQAMADGGKPDPDLGKDWTVWQGDVWRNMQHWCKAAHDYVLTLER